jgi:hypothetical protein
MQNAIARALTAGALLIVTLAGSSPSRAEIVYPWCVQYGGGRDGIGATNCGFVSREQCMQTASGLGAMCMENPAYAGPSSRPTEKRNHKHS